MVIYVVKNASRPVSGEDSPVPNGKRFVFQIVCIVTLRRVLCKSFLRGGAAQSLRGNKQRNSENGFFKNIKGDCFYYPIAIY